MHVTVKKLSVGRGSPSKKARKPSKINDYPVQEIVKRVKLDHTYALPANAVEYQRQVDPAFYNLLDEVEGGEDAAPPKSLIKNSQAAKITKVKYGLTKGQTQAENSTSRSHNDALDSENKRDHSGILRKSESGETVLSPSSVGTAVESDRNGNTKDRMDLYQPDDSKYKNFNLLLKCLTNEGPHERNSGINSVLPATESGLVKKGDFQGKEKLDRESSQEEKCDLCTKTFSSKAYLRKHKQHMHSNFESEVKVNVPESEICPECSLNVEKKKMNEHKSICSMKQGPNSLHSIVNKSLVGASNIATCQFCPVKLRRPLLLKHLADKHCLENKEDGMLSDSGSSTVSGSDVENKFFSSQEEENIIQCDICFAFVPKPLLSQHIAEKHFSMVSGTGYVAGLSGNELTTSEGGGSLNTVPELTSQRSSYSSSRDVQDSQDSNISSSRSTDAFKQYMLQRFLDDNRSSIRKEDVNTNGIVKDSEVSQRNSLQVQSGLVTGVNVSRQNIPPINSTKTNTHGIYTVVVTKEMTAPRNSNPSMQRPSPVEQLHFKV